MNKIMRQFFTKADHFDDMQMAEKRPGGCSCKILERKITGRVMLEYLPAKSHGCLKSRTGRRHIDCPSGDLDVFRGFCG